jgi:gliding motility-associated-like protein
MKKSCFGKFHYLLLLMALSLPVSGLLGQGFYNTTNWRFSNPKQFGFLVQDLDFVDDNRGIAVGSPGGIAYTTDGGVKWNYGPFTFINAAGLRTSTAFSDVHFITTNIAYAVGSNGCMAKTTDGGVTWSFVNTPLFANGRSINSVWFTDANRGFIGGQWNTADSIPKLYFTLNGGASWDSINAPLGGKTRVGYINNPNIPSAIWDVSAKAKEIHRIEFSGPNTGYIVGSGSSIFPRVSNSAISSSNCLPNPTGNLTTGSHSAALVWKYDNGVLTDFSLSKERLGYSGINTNSISCITTYGSITPQSQTYRAMNIINDSLIVLMSSSNNIVVRVHAGILDSTVNIATGLKERGRYVITSFPFPPTAGPNAGPPIPNPNNLLASGPVHMKRAANGKLFVPVGSNVFDPANRMYTSVDTGRTWQEERNLPIGQPYSTMTNVALDILPSGRFFAAGVNGVMSDSIPGGAWTSSYVTSPPAASYLDFQFADCNNGIAAGGSSITVTTNGGNSWVSKARTDFVALNISINGLAYPSANKVYIATSVGNLYSSTDQATTLDPSYVNNLVQLNDVVAMGNDSVWAVAYSSFSVPSASRTSSIIRSYDGGVNWQQIGGFPVGTTAPVLSKISFSSRSVGYVAGSRNAVYKTTDGGSTWTDISPFPLLNNAPTGFPSAFVTYQEVVALNDNTVFLIGNMFTSTGIKRVYKTTDGGANWTDITGSLPAQLPVGNLIGLAVHDANNLYVTAGNTLFYTNDGGTNWTMDMAPTNNLFETMTFAPKSVPAGIPMANRKLFVCGLSAPTANGSMMEYGNPLFVNVNSSEVVSGATCTNLSGGSITINASGGIAPYRYSINGGALQTSNVFSGLTQGPKTITVVDAFCGTLTKTVNVGFTDNLVLTTSNDTTVCAGATVPMLASTNGTGASFTWTPTGSLNNPNISNPTATVFANTVYTVRATLNGCVKTKNINVGIKPNPVIDAGPNKTILEGDQVQLEGSASNAVSIAWTPAATLSHPATLNPYAKPNTTTVYTLTVRNSDGCTSTDNATVTVVPYCINVRNAFTPNRDGFNDLWLVTNGTACASKVKAIVFNRYGQEVYVSENYQNNWDGTYKGKPVPDGTYYYAVTFFLINGRQHTVKGDVTILR